MFGALKKGLQSLGEKLGLTKSKEPEQKQEIKSEVKTQELSKEEILVQKETKKQETNFIETKKEKPKLIKEIIKPEIKKEILIEEPLEEIIPQELQKQIELIKEEEKIIETKVENKQIELELPKPKEEILEEKPKVKTSIFTKLKSVFAEKYFLSDNEISELIEQFELSMLQSDVSLQVCELLTKSLKDKIKKEGVSKSHQEEYLKKLFLDIVFENYPKAFDENFFNQAKKPFIILFVGTNGGGKTTNIAKLAYYLKSKGKSVVFAASDTYRAAAIDQLEGHATKLGVSIIKGKYGQDPASVAYDAVTFAKSKNIDFVLIDSSGRQDNAQNLMKELEKIKKVINPDFTVFVAEAISGQTALAQAESFNKYINFDAFILTKVDVDEKGGTLLSISLGLKKPILFLGVGQEYKDIAFFDKEFLENVI